MSSVLRRGPRALVALALCAWAVACRGSSGPGPDGGGSASMNPNIHFVGRFDTRDPAGPRFAWPGSAIAATFEGTGIRATLSDTGSNYFAVTIDGEPQAPLATRGTKKTYDLAGDLAPGRHTLMLTKRTESNVGVVQLLALTPTDGAILPSPYPFTRRIEFIGDSITCGYGNLGKNGSRFSPATEDETVAYGGLAAAEFGAQQTVIAYSGLGMYRAWDGKTDRPMPLLFQRTLADDPTSVWDFAASQPDVVVINLSDNDFYPGDPGPPFVQAYTEFLKVVRRRYPNAYVLCGLSPMLEGPKRGASQAAILAAIAQARDPRVSLLEAGGGEYAFFEQRVSDGIGCDGHPSVATHRIMARMLIDGIRRVTGW